MKNWARWTPLCGVIFVVLLVVSFVLSGSTPGSGATGARVLSFYNAHKGAQQGSAYVGVYAAVFLLFFGAAFRSYLRRSRPESGPLAALSFGGALVIAVGGVITSTTQLALSDVPDKLSPAAAQALNVLNNDIFMPVSLGACVFMIANGLAAVRYGALPAWLGWLAIVIGIVSVTPVGFVALLVAMAWVLVVSILIVVREPAAAAEETPPERPAAAAI